MYCDPTYTVSHNNNDFVRYNERNFSWADRERLARAADRAVKRGAVVLVSNAAHDDLAALYPTAQEVGVTRWSGLCPRPAKRAMTDEILFILHPTHRRTSRKDR